MSAAEVSEALARMVSLGIHSVYETVNHLESMRKAIERMEMYILLLMALFYIIFCGIILGLSACGCWTVFRLFRRHQKRARNAGKHEQL